MGYLEKQLSPDDKQELLRVTEELPAGAGACDYPADAVLVQPHLRRPSVPDWVSKQVYLTAGSNELM